MDTKPLTKLVLLIVVLLTAAVGFCQSDDPPPGGAGPTFSVTIVPMEGLDEFSILVQGESGAPKSQHWTRDWVEGVWRVDGVAFSDSGFGLIGLAPTVPVMHQIANTPAGLQMTSAGKQKICVQYSGTAEQMPEIVGLVVTSQSDGYFGSQNAGYADVDNGLGDPATSTSPAGAPSFQGMFGLHSYGNNLRFVKLDSTGYGELVVESYAEASQAGYNSAVWAQAEQLAAVVDMRDIDLISSFSGPFYTAFGPFSNVVAYTVTYSNGLQVTREFENRYNLPLEVKPRYSALASKEITVDIGISIREYEWDGMYTGGWDQPFSLTGSSTFPRWAEHNRHGTYSWSLARRYWRGFMQEPLEGELPVQASALRLDEGEFEYPRVWLDEDDVVRARNEGSVGDLDSYRYRVTWADGVVGVARMNFRYHHLAEQIFETGVQQFYESGQGPLLPIKPATPLGNYPDNWLPGSMSTAKFWVAETSAFLKWYAANQELSALLANAVLTVIPSSNSSKAMELVASLISYSLSEDIKNLARFISRPTDPARILSIDAGNYAGSQPIEQLWLEQPGLFSWQLWAEPAVWIANTVGDKYSRQGFLGSQSAPQVQWESIEQAHHWIKLKFDVIGGL